MRKLTRLVYCGAGAAILILAGCSGSGGSMATPSAGNAVQQDSVSMMRPPPGLNPAGLTHEEFPLLAAQGPRTPLKGFVNSAALAKNPTTIAVSDYINDVVNIYDPAGDVLAQLTGFIDPHGLASDNKGDLYVADLGYERVEIYPAGFTSPPTVLNISGYNPIDVDSFNNGQIVAVCNIFTPSRAPGNVEFFTNGQLTNTVSSSTITYVDSCAFDALGNLYVEGQDANYNSHVGEIVGGARGNQITLLTTSNTIPSPFGIQVTTSGQLAVGEYAGEGNQHSIYTYNPPIGGSLGSPVVTTTLTAAFGPEAFAFSKNMNSLYLANCCSGPNSYYTVVVQEAYPAGGQALSRIPTHGQSGGITVIPAQFPKVQK
ncbi:MAG: hypothetical protein IAI50_15085 [Candidatus Eremiobacteraeota bacterium]|nr:hypothetical protein [Candidatus Eremiobacteraeota bacterium]